MNNLVITISRTYGSEDSLIGREIAQILGIAYYNRILIDKIAQKRFRP